MLTRLEIYLIAFLALAIAAGGAYFYAKHQGVMEERQRWELKEADSTKVALGSLTEAVKAGNTIAGNTLEALKKNAGNRTIDRGVIQREIQTNTLYASDCFPATGLVQWNRINAGQPLLPVESAGGQPGPAMPKGNGAALPGQQRGHLAPKSP